MGHILKIILLTFSFTNLAKARQAERDDFSYELIKQDTVVDVESDGKYVLKDTSVFKITQESGKETFSMYKKYYYENRYSLKVDEAYVVTNGTTHSVSPDRIEEKFVSGEGQGFDSLKEITIAFPALEVGSEIHLRSTMTANIAVVAGHFSMDGTLGEGLYEEGSNFTVRSKIPISVFTNDPYKLLNVSETKLADGRYEIAVLQKRGHLKGIVDESSLVPSNERTTYRISTDKDWTKIAKTMSDGFEKVLKEELHATAIEWVKNAKKMESLVEQVDYLVAEMSNYFLYVGDWRTVQGSYAPRPIQKIWDSRQGDCKDFATVLSQMLRRLGYSASIALVERSNLYEKYSARLKGELKSINDFNHAIVHLANDGKSFWIDPTNTSSYGLNHRQDIAGKWSLILNENAPSKLEQLTDVSSSDISQFIEKKYKFKNESEADVETLFYLEGEGALPYLGVEKKVTKQNLKDRFAHAFAYGDNFGVVDFKDFDLTKYNYSPVKLEWKYSASKIGASNSSNRVMTIPASTLALTLASDLKKYKGSLILGQPQKLHRKYTFEGISAIGRFPQNCEIKTKWIDISRKYDLTEEGVNIDELYELKSAIVDNSDYESTDLKMLQADFYSCFYSQSFTYVYGKGLHSTTSANLASLFKELELSERIAKRKEIAWHDIYSQGRKRVSQYNTQEAISLLKMNISENPKDAESYSILSRLITDEGYLNNDNYTTDSLQEAMQIVTVGLQIVPDDIGLHIALAVVLAKSKQFDMAKTIYNQIVSSAKVSEYFHFISLSWLANKLKNEVDSSKYLYMAKENAKTDDQKSEVYFRIAQYAYDKNDNEKCIEFYKETTKVDPSYFWAWLNSVNCYINIKDFDGAVDAGKHSYDLVPYGMSAHNYGRALFGKGVSLIGESKFEDAIVMLSKSIEAEKESKYFLRLGEAYVKSGNFEKAKEILEAGIPHVDKNIRNYYVTVAEYLKNDPETYEKYMLKGFDTSTYAGQKLWHYYHLMYNFNSIGEYQKAWEYSEKAIVLGDAHILDTPDDEYALAELGKIRFLRSKMSGRLDELVMAETHYQNALLKNPELKAAKNGLEVLGATNGLIGRNPASTIWNAKAILHNFLLQNLEYRLINW